MHLRRALLSIAVALSVVGPAPATTWAGTASSARDDAAGGSAARDPARRGGGLGRRPYAATSPWNTPIGPDPAIDPNSAAFVDAIADNDLPLTSDPDQYAIPVYRVGRSTPRRTVELSGYFSSYDRGDADRKGHGFAPTVRRIPVPRAAAASAGSDGQIVLWNTKTDTEYSFWQFHRDRSGTYRAANGYRYHTGGRFTGRFADGLAGRGAGTPYLAGLVRRWELMRGRVEHALAFAYDSPSADFRFPASKSDGGQFGGVRGADLPEGARLQLDPGLRMRDFRRWGLSRPGRVLARAMQTYGMYVVDHSGSSKIYLEDRMTARWPRGISRDTVSSIPWSAFRVIAR